MSTSPYSIDLREKVIKYLEAGNSQRSASRVFQLSPTTVNTWHVRYKKEGHYQARKYKGAKPSIEMDDFIKYVEENPNSKTEDIGKKFGISASGARYWLRQLGFSYKKKPLPMWKLMLKSDVSI
ncbi:MAG: IS630 transposase-related protein [Rickettsia endosymbiont of Culicoides impunctatus]|uniref:helix-turn-helix domain-containing protein n=1 Tax=unclassified Candidatus Tisiphia TaxID=2996318 RepID=UPI001E762185|nr:MAG: IS630 transposase-related protein [Rickettsia endosymbiont of Culicoides impunctatus]UCM85937.1 MAG: IS630 transposase-related protein [Rickettsia endosymbiont of Culicoides impunctatus]UCM86090.1 MAG: IS630 transposase-related protein [Rickettsia endosymbiont of Culicoides impunctatus]